MVISLSHVFSDWSVGRDLANDIDLPDALAGMEWTSRKNAETFYIRILYFDRTHQFRLQRLMAFHCQGGSNCLRHA